MLLFRYLKIYDFNLEKAKKLLLVNLEMRAKNPDLFEKRDLLSDEFQRVYKVQHVFSMPETTPENNKVTIFRIVESDTDKYNVCEIFRFLLATLDAKLVTTVTNEENDMLHDGDIFVNDMTNFGFKVLMKFIANLSLVKNHLKYSQEATPMKMVQNHYVNCSAAIPKLLSFLKPFLNKEVADSLYFHSNLETLHAIVPKECLPEEYGGTGGKSEEINRVWMEIFMSKR